MSNKRQQYICMLILIPSLLQEETGREGKRREDR